MTDANTILVEGGRDQEPEVASTPSTDLVSWVMGNVVPWRQIRDSQHKPKWDHWFAVWMGIWRKTMKTRKSERSRIVSPGSQMAVDLTVAEIVEGTFAHRLFFGLSDDATPEEREAATESRERLTQDLLDAGIRDAFAESTLNGALYGTGIMKLAMDVKILRSIERVPVMDGERDTGKTTLKANEEEEVVFTPVAIEPGNFVPDPSATDIDDMLGCAHEFRMPLHIVKRRQAEGTYFNFDEVSPAPAGAEPDSSTTNRKSTPNDSPNNQWAHVAEWHGLVPARMLTAVAMQKTDLAAAQVLAAGDDDTLVEAIVTIANEGQLLRAIPAPTLLKDRAIVSWQHDTVPNSFWGRGVMQKGHNVQAATDAEMRARVDNLAWASNPMMAVKASALVPGSNMNIWPGKVWALREGTQDSLKEFKFGEINGSSFQQTAELATWMSQATGTVDTIAARQNVRDEATGAAAIQQSGFLKRARSSMYNIETAMTRFVRRTLWRKMQFDGKRYPGDFDFIVEGTSGLMAREMEQQQNISTLQFLEQGSPEQLLMLKKIFSNSTSDDKAEMLAVIEQRMQGPSEEEKAAQKAAQDLEIETKQLENAKLRAETRESMAKTLKIAEEAGLASAKEALTRIQAETESDAAILEVAGLQIDQQEVDNQQRQLDISEEGNAINRDKLEHQKIVQAQKPRV